MKQCNKTLYNRQTKTIDRKQFLLHYRFDEKEASELTAFQEIIEPKIDEILDGYYLFIFGFEHAKTFLDTPEILARHRDALRIWVRELFGGRYDEAYFQRLEQISFIHVRIGLPVHYVNAAFSYLRETFNEILREHGRLNLLSSVNRIIDINLDILSLSYLEMGKQKFIDDIAILKRVIDREAVEPYIQPIVNAKTGLVEKFECLMRLVDEKNDRVYSIFPFLGISKEIHVYSILMKQVLDRCFETISHFPSYSFTINLGYEDIENEDFRRFICNEVARLPAPEKIVFEVLESDFIQDFDIIKEFIEEIRHFGCRIAIDDFGTGYSNMKNILELRPDYLKIDGSIVREIDRVKGSYAIVKNVIHLARDLGIQTIAEHVQNAEVLEKLREIGVDYYQGFYLGKPFPITELNEGYPKQIDLDREMEEEHSRS